MSSLIRPQSYGPHFRRPNSSPLQKILVWSSEHEIIYMLVPCNLFFGNVTDGRIYCVCSLNHLIIPRYGDFWMFAGWQSSDESLVPLSVLGVLLGKGDSEGARGCSGRKQGLFSTVRIQKGAVLTPPSAGVRVSYKAVKKLWPPP